MRWFTMLTDLFWWNSMGMLLEKFRIPIQEVVVISELTAPPSTATKTWFDALTRDLIRKDEDMSEIESTRI